MSSRRSSQSDGGGALFGIFMVIALLWWLRWIILAVLFGTAIVFAARWFLRWHAELRATELARNTALRQRAETENAQVLRGDPAGFFGRYPLPDPELIPRWFKDA
ncbi:MAG: hypothetical protein ABI307_15335 [Mycobacterium sp.]